jgi:CheY-like chemotaxis protein
MKTIWIVDDEPDIRTVVAMMLEKEGYEVVSVEDGEACLKLIEGGQFPDLILLDVMMPGIDGWKVCRTIKNNRTIDSIPICMLTAKTAPQDVQRSLIKANANWHLNKPIDRHKLLEAIEWLLNMSLYKKP